MTEFNSNERLWVGMDIDAEFARYAEEDRSRAAEPVTPSSPKRPSRRRSLRAAIPTLGKGSAPRFPLAA